MITRLSDLKFERLTYEVILIDGKYYRQMTDKEAAEFIWSADSDDMEDAARIAEAVVLVSIE